MIKSTQNIKIALKYMNNKVVIVNNYIMKIKTNIKYGHKLSKYIIIKHPSLKLMIIRNRNL
jgi:ribosomal protein L30E